MSDAAIATGERPPPGRAVPVRAPVTMAFAYTQTLLGTPDEVFALLCPVREAEWVPGWRPSIVLSASGLVERDCAFVTPDGETPDGAAREATWVVTEHDAEARRVEMLKVSPGYLVTRLRIDVAAVDCGSTAHVRYRYTALGPDGEAFVRGRTPAHWAEFMQSWETSLNAYLDRARSRHPG
ncbi:MAG: hypothetical protein ACJ79S_21620 [Gemmatimonadaceae bacterium]